MSVAQIKRWNNLSSNNIRVGQRLTIYRGGKAPASTASKNSSTSSGEASAKTASSQTAASQTSAKSSQPSASQATAKSGQAATPVNASYINYTVKDGESLYLIAKKFPGVSAQNIMDFNKIGSNIKPGMVIRIPKL